MIQTKFGTCYLCEIKINPQEITKNIIDEVFAGLMRQKDITEINAIGIDENHRRQGLGKALIKWLEKVVVFLQLQNSRKSPMRRALLI